MDFLVNDLSLHGQFVDLGAFRESMSRVMQIREVARRYGRSVYCHRAFVNGQVTQEVQMPEAVQALSIEQRRAVMIWLTQHGPFWDDHREHDRDDWYECHGEIVTDTAVGEAAHGLLHGINRGLVSLSPSSYTFDPVAAERVLADETRQSASIRNYWEPTAFEAFVASAPPVLKSWAGLAVVAIARFSALTFAKGAFVPLQGHPFVPGAAQRIVVLLDVLHRMKQCFNDDDGGRSREGHRLYQEFFTGTAGDGGRGAAFSDSSDSEKNAFKSDLTFPNPVDPSETLFCTWHGKVQTPQFRIHFSYPIRRDDPLFVVHVGPKITKR